MANKFVGHVKTGATGIIVPVFLRSTSNNQGLTAVAAGSVTGYYFRSGGSVTPITVTGNWTELHATNMPGSYTLALPDAMFADGAEWVLIVLRVSGAYDYAIEYRLEDDILDKAIGDTSYVSRTRPVRGALRRLRNRNRINGSTLEIYQENDTTTDWTAAVTTAAGNPITETDPA